MKTHEHHFNWYHMKTEAAVCVDFATWLEQNIWSLVKMDMPGPDTTLALTPEYHQTIKQLKNGKMPTEVKDE